MEDFIDMEGDVQPAKGPGDMPPKRKRIEAKPVAKSPKPRATEQVDKVIELANGGYNVNQIASMLALHSQFVKETINKANENL